MKKLLIANRGEIAIRIARTAADMGIATLSVHSDDDAASLHTRRTDETRALKGTGPVAYLDSAQIIAIARETGCDAIHPGYGFLSENADFARACAKAGLIFVGPDPDTLDLFGNKATARIAAQKAAVPVIDGISAATSLAEAQAFLRAQKPGSGVMVKAVAGGGGRGMRPAHSAEELERAYQLCASEAQQAFGNGELYVERLFPRARHIEVQIVADNRGHVVHLGERDCSIQRRHQKLVEETPSPAIDERLRREIGRTAVEAVKAIRYCNVGTVEFLLDKDRNFFFMEVNTRIQVEHPITEMVTGIDLVKEQIRIASGMPLSFKQPDIKLNGHSFECRINAEDPEKFTPRPGQITKYSAPGGLGIRVDSAMAPNATVVPYYDSLIAKLITHGRDRQEAMARMRRALDEFVIEGIKTTIPLHRKIFNDPDFQKGHVSTTFLDRFLAGQSS